MSLDYAEREGMARFELPLLMLLASLGMALMISANDLISLYVGLELQSLALYVVGRHPPRHGQIDRGRPQILSSSVR